jgi:hypothetical protein
MRDTQYINLSSLSQHDIQDIWSYSLHLHEPKYNHQPPVDAMDNFPLFFVTELLVLIGIVENLALAFFQMLVAGVIMSLELQVGTCFGIRVCHFACCFGLDLDTK